MRCGAEAAVPDDGFASWSLTQPQAKGAYLTMSDAQTRPDDIVSLITTGRCHNRKDGAQLPALSARPACRVAIKVFGSVSHPRRRACLASSPDGKPPQACSRFSSCPVFRQSAVVSDPGEAWFRLVESSSRRQQL